MIAPFIILSWLPDYAYCVKRVLSNPHFEGKRNRKNWVAQAEIQIQPNICNFTSRAITAKYKVSLNLSTRHVTTGAIVF